MLGELADVHLVSSEYLCRIATVHSPSLCHSRFPFLGLEEFLYSPVHFLKIHSLYLKIHSATHTTTAIPSVRRIDFVPNPVYRRKNYPMQFPVFLTHLAVAHREVFPIRKHVLLVAQPPVVHGRLSCQYSCVVFRLLPGVVERLRHLFRLPPELGVTARAAENAVQLLHLGKGLGGAEMVEVGFEGSAEHIVGGVVGEARIHVVYRDFKRRLKGVQELPGEVAEQFGREQVLAFPYFPDHPATQRIVTRADCASPGFRRGVVEMNH